MRIVHIVLLLVASVMSVPEARYVFVGDETGTVRLVDPTTGNLRWQTGGDGEYVAVAPGRPGLAFVSVAARDGATTAVFALPLAQPNPVRIGEVPGRAVVGRLAPDGSTLFVTRYDATFTEPVEIVMLPVPLAWRGPPATPTASTGSFAAISADGRRWYGMQTSVSQTAIYAGVRLRRFEAGDWPVSVDIPLSTDATYFSLLLAPDGQTLYAVDHGTAGTVSAIDSAGGTITRRAALRPVGTKRSSCAAALSPDGSRIYALAYDGTREDGIDVIETSTLRRVAHFLPGERLVCVAASPDGNHLYVSAVDNTPFTPTLRTLDAYTGAPVRTVPLRGGVPFLALVA